MKVVHLVGFITKKLAVDRLLKLPLLSH